MFSKLDHTTGSITYSNENEPEKNAHLMMGALLLLPLVESINSRMHDLVFKVAEAQHRISPVGETPPDDAK